MANFLLPLLRVILIRWLDLTSLLCRSLRSIVTDLISKEYFWTIHFAALYEGVAKNLSAGGVPPLLLTTYSIDNLQIRRLVAMPTCHFFGYYCIVHRSWWSLRGQRWR